MVCSKCGENNEGTNFCIKCGEKLIILPPGRMFIKVTGILYIIFAFIGFISGGMLLSSLNKLDPLFMYSMEIPLSVFKTITIFSMIAASLQALIGILGVKYCNDLEKTKVLLICVIGLFAMGITSIIITAVYGLLSWVSIFEFVLPILFLVGVLKNLKAIGGLNNLKAKGVN